MSVWQSFLRLFFVIKGFFLLVGVISSFDLYQMYLLWALSLKDFLEFQKSTFSILNSYISNNESMECQHAHMPRCLKGINVDLSLTIYI